MFALSFKTTSNFAFAFSQQTLCSLANLLHFPNKCVHLQIFCVLLKYFVFTHNILVFAGKHLQIFYALPRNFAFACKSFAFYVETLCLLWNLLRSLVTLNLLARLVIWNNESGKLYLETVKVKYSSVGSLWHLTLFPEINKMLNMQRCIDVKMYKLNFLCICLTNEWSQTEIKCSVTLPEIGVCVCVVCLRVAVWGCWKVCIRMSLSQLLYTINTFSIVLSAMSTYSQCFSPYSTSQLLMVTLSGILCFHSLLSALKVNFRAAHTYKCILDTKRASIHLSVLLFTSLSSTVAESNLFFLFSLSDLLVPCFPLSLISVPPFTLLSLPVTSHIKPFCTLLFVPLFNARAPLFLQSFFHKTLKALILSVELFKKKTLKVHVLYFLMLCFGYFQAELCVHKQSTAVLLSILHRTSCNVTIKITI